MAKHTNGSKAVNRTKPKDEPMNNAMKLFLAGCSAELYLLIVRRFYVTGTINQVVAWDSYLFYILIAGLVLAIAGGVGAFMFRADTGAKRMASRCVLGCGAFFALSSLLIRTFYTSALSLLCIMIPAVMLLGILWNLYDRECAWSLSVLSASLLMLWTCRRGLAHLQYGTLIFAVTCVFIALLGVVAFAAWKADHNKGMFGKYNVLPVNADPLPIYVGCGLSAAALVLTLVSTSLAYYAMWGLAAVIFLLAVYYTVKQL